jgi:hypothetical protein
MTWTCWASVLLIGAVPLIPVPAWADAGTVELGLAGAAGLRPAHPDGGATWLVDLSAALSLTSSVQARGVVGGWGVPVLNHCFDFCDRWERGRGFGVRGGLRLGAASARVAVFVDLDLGYGATFAGDASGSGLLAAVQLGGMGWFDEVLGWMGSLSVMALPGGERGGGHALAVLLSAGVRWCPSERCIRAAEQAQPHDPSEQVAAIPPGQRRSHVPQLARSLARSVQ